MNLPTKQKQGCMGKNLLPQLVYHFFIRQFLVSSEFHSFASLGSSWAFARESNLKFHDLKHSFNKERKTFIFASGYFTR